MNNPFLKEIEVFFKRIVELQSTLFQINNVLKKELTKLNNVSDETKEKFPIKLFSRLIIRDLSGPIDNDWGINLPIDSDKIVKWSGYDDEIDNLIAREAGYIIAQSCEAFVQYLKDVVAIQLMHNPKKAVAISNKFSSCDKEKEFKIKIREVRKLRSTKNLFQILDDTCNKFEDLRKNNNLGIELTNFYEALAFARHKITHSSSRFSPSDISDWTEDLDSVFNSYFTTIQLKNDQLIKMNHLQAKKVANRTAEIGYIIFKSLSICNNYEWSISQN